MHTYSKKGHRKFKLDNNKEALKQLNNFGNILNNMNELDKSIENYQGIITDDKLNEIANLINLEKRLSLTEDQVKLVTKKYV